jgi:hypothetical protein
MYKNTNNRVKFYHHHISVMELGHLLTRSGLTERSRTVKILYHEKIGKNIESKK